MRWEGGEVDGLYWADRRLAVIEVSGSFANNAQKMSGDWEKYREALRTAFVERAGGRGPEREAVSQLARDIAWLTELRRDNANFAVPLRQIAHIHPVMIAPDRVIKTHNVWKYLNHELRNRLPDAMAWDIAPLAVFSLEELEELEELVRRRDDRILGGQLPAFLHFLRLWQFNANRYPSLWQFIEDHFPGDFGSERLRAVSQQWRERSRHEIRTTRRKRRMMPQGRSELPTVIGASLVLSSSFATHTSRSFASDPATTLPARSHLRRLRAAGPDPSPEVRLAPAEIEVVRASPDDEDDDGDESNDDRDDGQIDITHPKGRRVPVRHGQPP